MRGSKLLSAVASVVLAGGVLAGIPAQAAEAEQPELGSPASEPNQNKGRGGASAFGVASAKAQKTDERVEIVAERTETDSVFANPDGTFTREHATAPIRAEDADGDLAPIDTDLAKDGNRLAPAVATGEVSFTADGEGRLATYDVAGGGRVGMDFVGELGSPQVEGAAATYPVAGAEGVSVRTSAGADGFAADVILAEPPAAGDAEPESEEPAPEASPSPAQSPEVEESDEATEGGRCCAGGVSVRVAS